ncbi:MAG: signal peptide peptidase SppA [Chloroflexi bacterium OLB14]|nr:MAG: signal peptide peptidase SppA [Chloroflexi bacterium OLB14]
MTETNKQWEKYRIGLLWVVLPLIVGLILASSIVPQPVIGVIRLEDAIYGYTAQSMIKQIQYAAETPEIKAVVLVFESPGGTVVDTEAVYFELTKLRAKKPVVTAVNAMAASGAYYLSVNTDYIFAKPTSLVGNIGVIGYLPTAPFIIEDTITTGPYKLFGSERDDDMRQIEMVKQGFFEAVNLGRGDKLTGDPAEIFSGKIWVGIDALHLGIIDALGGEAEAIAKAAELAKVANYKMLDLKEPAGVDDLAYPFFFQSDDGMIYPYPNEAGVYLLYIPPLPIK